MASIDEERPLKKIRSLNEDGTKESEAPQLPVELLRIIFDYYLTNIPKRRETMPCEETKEISQLSKVNHTFRSIFLPELWKHVCIYGATENGERIMSRSCGKDSKCISWLQPGCGIFCESEKDYSTLSIPFIDSTLESISIENSSMHHDACKGVESGIDWIKDDPHSLFGFRLEHNGEEDEQPPLCYWFTKQCMIGAEKSLKEVNFDRALSPLTIPALLPLWIFFERIGEWSCFDANYNIAKDWANGIAWLRKLLLKYQGQKDENWIKALLQTEFEELYRQMDVSSFAQVNGLDDKPFDLWRLLNFLEDLGLIDRQIRSFHGSPENLKLCANLAKVIEKLKARAIPKKESC